MLAESQWSTQENSNNSSYVYHIAKIQRGASARTWYFPEQSGQTATVSTLSFHIVSLRWPGLAWHGIIFSSLPLLLPPFFLPKTSNGWQTDKLYQGKGDVSSTHRLVATIFTLLKGNDIYLIMLYFLLFTPVCLTYYYKTRVKTDSVLVNNFIINNYVHKFLFYLIQIKIYLIWLYYIVM